MGGGYTRTIVSSWGAVGVAIFFFLSGYGNYYSVEKISNEYVPSARIQWIIHRIAKLVITFVLCYILVVLITALLIPDAYNIKEYFINFMFLKLPGTSTWYLKIQILMYVFIWFSSFIPKRMRSVCVAALSLVYVIIAYSINLPDYWWKTSLCFCAGMFIAQCKPVLERMIHKYHIQCIVFAMCAFILGYSYIILLAKDYLLLPQCISYVAVSVGICLLLSFLHPMSGMLSFVGDVSLEIYLIHIGILLPIVTTDHANTSVVLYIFLSLTGAFLIHKLADKLLRIF